MNERYEIILYWSAEDDAFVAEVPELPGCAAHGASQSEALASVQDAIALWIDTARETNLSVPTPKGRRLASPKLLLSWHLFETSNARFAL
jgi:predicted RNase H-like HicB family nuclease